MIERKKKLKFIQLTLLILGILIIYFTYYGKEKNVQKEIISKSTKKKIEKQILEEDSVSGDLFFDVTYTGFDLNGNRYALNSEEAYLDEEKPEIVYMNIVNSVFYFKDDTILYIWADKGIYNNKTLDMQFQINVKANYLDSKLFAEKAEYSNSKSHLVIYENVRVNDPRGNLIADKLFFDITDQELNITSYNDGNVNANVKLNEKKF